MVIMASRIRDISFSSLMEVYRQSNQENARHAYFQEPKAVGLRLAEEDFREYLKAFFRTPGAVCAIWIEAGRYVSALRLEPWRDGLLLTGLETAPEHRGKGYAQKLIRSALEYFPMQKMYSHVRKDHFSSLRAHRRCGFEILSDCARFLDGSADHRAFTLCHTPDFPEESQKLS